MLVVDYTTQAGWHAPRVRPLGPLGLHPASGVLHYGQAIFEGLKAFRGVDGKVRLFRKDRHYARLNTSAEQLCMPTLPTELLDAGLTALLQVEADWVPSSPGTALYLRPTLVANEPFLGVRPANQYVFFVILSPVGSYFAGGALTPVKIWVERKHVRAAKGGLGAAKAGANYAASLTAQVEAKKRGYSQVLWLDAAEHRYVEEVGTMNLFALIGDELVTPPLDGSILPGVTRDSVLVLAREWGLKVSERPLSLEELVAAGQKGTLREVFGTGTAAVISPVGELGMEQGQLHINGGEAGPLALKLHETITGIQYGRLPDTHGWLTEVDLATGGAPERLHG
jgi:branched-chain amino acid aminotransferase